MTLLEQAKKAYAEKRTGAVDLAVAKFIAEFERKLKLEVIDAEKPAPEVVVPLQLAHELNRADIISRIDKLLPSQGYNVTFHTSVGRAAGQIYVKVSGWANEAKESSEETIDGESAEEFAKHLAGLVLGLR